MTTVRTFAPECTVVELLAEQKYHDDRLGEIAGPYDTRISWKLRDLQTAAQAAGVQEKFLPQLRYRGKKTEVAVVVIHGFGQTPPAVEALAKAYERQGANVLSIVLPGHGIKPEAMHGVTWQQWQAAVVEGARFARELGDKVVLAGFSVGGSLALNLQFDHPELVDGVDAFSPMLGRSDAVRTLLDARLERFKASGTFDPESRDAWMRRPPGGKNYSSSGIEYSSCPMSAYGEVVELEKILRAKWSTRQLQKPPRVVWATNDSKSDLGAIRDFVEMQHIPQDSTKSLTGPHEITIDTRGDEWTKNGLEEFIRARVVGGNRVRFPFVTTF